MSPVPHPVRAALQHRFVDVPAGSIHCVLAGTGRPVLLLHQTPRSWDEYRDVLPLLGRHVQAIAVDTIGFGDSCKPPLGQDSIEHWAQVSVGLLDALGIEHFAVVGHVGDGNFHLPMLVDGDDASEVEAAKRLNEQVVRRALALDGTCSGEHGIGMGKSEFLLTEHGPVALEVMRAIKRTLDPLGILNPGKMFVD